MLDIIRSLPEQLKEATRLEIPDIPVGNYRRVIVGGMGGSAIGGDVARDVFNDVDFSIETVRGYDLPAYAKPDDTLFVSVSYSGNTEETLSLLNQALERGLSIVAITSGGKLADISREKDIPLITIPSGYPPRGALGWLFGAMAMALEKAGLLGGVVDAMERTAGFLKSVEGELGGKESLSMDLANKFYRRLPIVYVPADMVSVALRWQAQINENAKQLAHINVLPEMNHNEINGIKHPVDVVERSWVVFLKDRDTHPRILRRIEITRQLIEESVMGMDVVESMGESRMERIFYLIWLGDFVSFYLALYNQEDPMAIPRISSLKDALSREG